ncbi:CRISPR-associated endonuclease Cas2 [Macrococcoides canis]|uniref:CRISPR-associated endonuclease Cas2 n=1 Tax=Macrococcoides canis TaxID=1855823 RepID=UPI0013E98F4C|nr:CRISPR-associated endonuclease Cas2 [Macrococcus canis]QIH75213.1 CRISPR-associated endonuclease Cas2 [Macrococcus canis]
MILLVCFDLPRDNLESRRAANRYRKKLLELGFSMKQWSLYERKVKNNNTADKIIGILGQQIPDYVNDNQITILGEYSIKKAYRKARVVVI